MDEQALIETENEFTSESAEEHRVRRWRLDQFVGLGFTQAVAAMLTSAPVDLHLARRLVGAGCPLETAARILL
jgi:hypothetical protein